MEEPLLEHRAAIDEANPKKEVDLAQGNGSFSDSESTQLVMLSSFVALCGSLCYGCIVGYSSPAEAGIIRDLNLSVADYSVFASILTIGGIIGALINGKLTDLLGRRATMGICGALNTVGWIFIAFGKNARWLDTGRLLLGIGYSIICYVVPIYISEISTKNIRGRLASSHQLMSCCGISLMFFLGNVVSWRNLALIGVIPSLLQIFGLFFVPESPRWLAKVGRQEELEAALRRLRGKNAHISDEIMEYMQNCQTNSERILDLFQWRYAHSLIVGVGLIVLQESGGSASIITFMSSIFAEAGFPTSVGTITMAVIQIPAVMLSVLLTDRVGRRPLLLFSAAGTCLNCVLLGLAYLFMDYEYLQNFTPTLVYTAIMGFTVTFVMGMAGLPWVIISEIFPINVKGTAGSLVTLTKKLSGWIVIFTFNFMMQWSSSGTFFIYSAICGLTVVFIAKLVPETKGRSLEEIHASMSYFMH